MKRQLVPVRPRTRARETWTLRTPLRHFLRSRALPFNTSVFVPMPRSPARFRVVIGGRMSLHFGTFLGGGCCVTVVCVGVGCCCCGGSGGRCWGSPCVPAWRQGENSDVLPCGS